MTKNQKCMVDGCDRNAVDRRVAEFNPYDIKEKYKISIYVCDTHSKIPKNILFNMERSLDD